METINDLLEINNLKIYQNDEWFKFSLESVLLPNFITLNLRCKNIIDLCTGNAPIPLILSTKTKANIVGVEIQKDVYELAKKSVEINKLDNRIKLINDNLNNLKKYYEGDYFDVVTVNPPYFPNIETSKKNQDIHKTIARHEIETNLSEIVKISAYLLKNGGYLDIVHQTNRFFDVVDVLKKYNFSINKVRFIYPKEDKESNLFMIEAIKDGNSGVKFLKPLYVHNNDGTYKEEILNMFKNKKEDNL
jgi:tRNA1(Val) A37 N6-methylase TrmN6